MALKWPDLGHFDQNDPFWGQHDVIDRNLGQGAKKFISKKVYKNYFSHVYGHKFGEKWH